MKLDFANYISQLGPNYNRFLIMHFVHMMAIISEESVYRLHLSGKVSFSYGMGTVSLFTWEFFSSCA